MPTEEPKNPSDATPAQQSEDNKVNPIFFIIGCVVLLVFLAFVKQDADRLNRIEILQKEPSVGFRSLGSETVGSGQYIHLTAQEARDKALRLWGDKVDAILLEKNQYGFFLRGYARDK